MGPATSTSTIPQFCYNYVKHQNLLGVRVTRSDLKDALHQQYKTAPWLFGTSNNGNDPASWVSSVHPTFRSMYSRMKNGTGGQLGLDSFLRVVTVDGVDYVFDKEDTYMKAHLGQTFRQQVEGVDIHQVDIHTTLQFKICSVGVYAGYKIFVPYKNRNIKIENGLSIGKVFSDDLVDDFVGMSNITREIDVLFLEDLDGVYKVVRAFEVENSTGVITGIGRMKALDCVGVIVSPHQHYKDKFDSYLEESFKEMKGKLVYRSSKEVFKFAESVEEYQGDAFSLDEIRVMIPKKF